MRIKVKMSGHQWYREYQGIVLNWCMTVEYYEGKPMQVPCVILRDGEEIRQVALKVGAVDAVIEVVT